MPKLLEFYHDKEESEPLVLTKQEQEDLAADWDDIKNQREYRDKNIQNWRWSGSVYNVVKAAQPDDRISQITIGWIKSYIDTGIAQMTSGEPDFDYEALGPSDECRTILWKNLVSTSMSRCNYGSHQKIAMTDSHVFGPGVMEVYQQHPYRTIREPNSDGTFTERIVVDHRLPRVGVRAVSPFRCTRNPNVSDPNEIASCTKEEILTWNQFVQNYGRVFDEYEKLKYKHIMEIPKGSHVKITKYQDETRDVYRIYALSYGNKSDGMSEAPPQQLGIPIFDRPLKIHDVYGKKGELLRSVGLNIPGMCSLIYFPYSDKLNSDYETHDIYGMGLPEQLEGLDTFMQTAFNMTVDNWKLANTVVIGAQSNDGTLPDFDANTYYGGEFINATVTPQSLGQDKTINFDSMYEVIQKLAIPGTGININQITGDTSRTAFEFAQRIEANNKRNEARLKEWEGGPLKRLGSLLLSACISELTLHDLENIREQDKDKVLADIKEGRATKDDFEFEKGKPAKRKVRYYIDVKGMKESFNKLRKSRTLDANSVNNTLVKDMENPNAIHKIPVTEEYVMPDWYVDSGVLFDTKVDSKRMITNKKIRDTQALQSVLNNVLQVVQLDPALTKKIDFSKFIEYSMRLADMEDSDFLKEDSGDGVGEMIDQIDEIKQSILNPNPTADAQALQNNQAPANMAGQADPGQPQAVPVGGAGTVVPQQVAA